LAKQEPTTAPKRFRREPGVGRQLMLQAAHDEFCERGFARATTRAIAERAGVAEPLLFRHFGSKAALFNEVVFGPFQKFMREWDETAVDVLGQPELSRRFVAGLYDLLRDNRGLVMTYLATSAFEPEVLIGGDGVAGFTDVILTMDRLSDKHAYATRPRGKAKRQLLIHERLNVGAVIAAALFDDLLFSAASPRPTRERIIDELTRIAIVSLPQPAD
jgi:AcrR family transcriptional regulator